MLLVMAVEYFPLTACKKTSKLNAEHILHKFCIKFASRVTSYVRHIKGGSNMTGTDLYVNKPHCAAAVRP